MIKVEIKILDHQLIEDKQSSKTIEAPKPPARSRSAEKISDFCLDHQDQAKLLKPKQKQTHRVLPHFSSNVHSVKIDAKQ